MKKLIRVLIILVLLFCVYILINKDSVENDIIETSSTEEYIRKEDKFNIDEPQIEWKAKYIRSSKTTNDTWTCYRKKINIENVEKTIAHISVDSQYWLYINGNVVVKQGGLKRGEEINSIYYENVDITNFLKNGENVIAILTWYWGDDSYSYISSGSPGLLFQAEIGNNIITSDNTWKVIHNPAYYNDGNIPNYRLAEFYLNYNANNELGDWYSSEFDDSLWESAIEICNAGEMPFGKLILKDIPDFKYSEYKQYENTSDYINYTTTKKEKLEMIIPYNAQINTCLKINSPKDLKIKIYTDQFKDISGDALYTTYITKEGIQEFEALSWINGEKVYYEIPAGVTILDLGYIESGYDTKISGNFECDDEFMNQLWQKSARTLYVNMRDTYMDCPTRERAQWWGDTSIEMLEAMYALDTNSYDLYKKGVRTVVSWQHDGILQTVVPISEAFIHIPVQMLLGVNSMYEYYEYTDNIEYLQYIYPSVKQYVGLWQKDSGIGLMRLSNKYRVWEWGDSAGDIDYLLLENMWYYLAINNVYKMANELGLENDIAYYDNLRKELAVDLNKYWTDKGYKSSDVDVVDERVNAVAVISGLASSDKYEIMKQIFENNYQTSSFMEKYILEAMCKIGDIEGAQDRMKIRYKDMVSGEKACSTLWENWNYDIGTKNHAWSGGPLVIMSKYFAGIEPIENGYNVVSIKPKFGKLNNISAKVDTLKGEISLDAKKNDNKLEMRINLHTDVKVTIEKCYEEAKVYINDKLIYENGKLLDKHFSIEEDENNYYIISNE